MATKKPDNPNKINSTVAKETDKSVQITFTIPNQVVEDEIEKILSHEAKHTAIPGFRSGKAPKHLVRKSFSEETLVNKALSVLLPVALTEALQTHKLNIIMYPRFQIIGKRDGVTEVRAVSCESPEIELGDYKAVVSTHKKTDIWVPGKTKDTSQTSNEQKDAEVVKVLLDHYKNILTPKILIEEEVNTKLSSLLERLEKLGLTLESYLQSTGKTAEALRLEYRDQVTNSLLLDFILAKIAAQENIKIDDQDALAYFKVANPNFKGEPKQDQLALLKQVLKKRKALDILRLLV